MNKHQISEELDITQQVADAYVQSEHAEILVKVSSSGIEVLGRRNRVNGPFKCTVKVEVDDG